MFGKLLDTAVNVATSPISSAVDIVQGSADIIDGLTVGELRTRAIAKVGVSVALGMTESELIELYKSST